MTTTSETLHLEQVDAVARFGGTVRIDLHGRYASDGYEWDTTLTLTADDARALAARVVDVAGTPDAVWADAHESTRGVSVRRRLAASLAHERIAVHTVVAVDDVADDADGSGQVLTTSTLWIVPSIMVARDAATAILAASQPREGE
jgi:hypothetical protein